MLDGAGWHKSKEIELAENVQEVLHNRAFDSLAALETHLEEALRILESSLERMRSIAVRDGIINSIFNKNWNYRKIVFQG